uniref:2-polyprenyl-6-hydroxyphenyl methylase/3-demethylubiquinone-9 3-methyltransferase n=1 Tax=Angomonas desouzai TaxID=59800 RepID=T1YRX1_9TRYP|nr:2-polyprenyl-6-hydroxyphenyl methylase/3-demethylubiquinone-9 3-methyltransferase [Angomonas desouzai]
MRRSVWCRSSAVETELQKFRRLQQYWYDPVGPLRTLHLFNPIRVQYLNQVYAQYGRRVSSQEKENDKGNSWEEQLLQKGTPSASFSAFSPSVKVLDVGCGGGILSESLSRLGATVTGIDLVEESVAVAQGRQKEGQTGSVSYAVTSVESLWEEKQKEENLEDALYDMVIASEVVEHVDDARGFLSTCANLVKPNGGLLVVSTMEKQPLTYLTHIAVAEHLTGAVHPGTHDWSKFINKKDMKDFFTKQYNTNRMGNNPHQWSLAEVHSQYILSYPSVWHTAATRQLQLQFQLTDCNTGHYFWTGKKL